MYLPPPPDGRTWEENAESLTRKENEGILPHGIAAIGFRLGVWAGNRSTTVKFTTSPAISANVLL